MKIKLPKINKIELDKAINYTSLKKLSFAGGMNIECFDCDCWDYDCDWDCQDYDCDYNPYDDCIDDCMYDCDCVCDCDCDFDLWDYGYIPRRKPSTPTPKSSNGDDEIHIIGVRFATQTRGCYYYRCKKPEYKIGDTLSVPTQYGSNEARVVFVRTYKDKNEYSKDVPYAIDSLKWAPEKKTLSQEELKKIEQERLAKEKAEKERLERERQERIRKEEENKKRILEEKTKIRSELISLKNKYKKDNYSFINFQTITNLISNFEKKLDNEKYLTYKQDYKTLILALSEVKTLEQEEAERKRKKIITIITSTIVAIVLLLIFVNNVIVPNAKYSNAINLFENGKYEEAEDVFYDLGDYKEAEIYIKLIDVKKQCDRKEYTKAISTLESIGGSSKFDIDYNGGAKSNSYINLYGKRINSSEKMGYTFKEYLTSSYSLDVKNKQLIFKVKATYTINQYSIKYYLDGGSLSKNNPTGYNVDTDTFVLNEPTKTGYEFLGWTYSGNSTPAKNVKITKGTTGNLIFTANWKAKSYLISFNSDGGNSISDLSATYDSNYSLPTPTKTGYSFSGWYNGNNLVSSNGTWKYTTNLNLVAKWSINSYSITYYLNGGKADNPSSYNVNTSTFTLNNPEKTGYKFVGWSTSANGTKYMNVTIEKGSVGVKTYYANWEVVTYNINYYLDSGRNNLNNPKTYTVEDSVQLNNPSKTGYTFEGWYSDSNFQNKVTTINQDTIGNLELYAKFVISTYKITVINDNNIITFLMNDGTDTIFANQIVNKSVRIEYPEIPNRKNYCFTGWYTEEQCLNLYDFSSEIKSDITLYAGWIYSWDDNNVYSSKENCGSEGIISVLKSCTFTVSMIGSSGSWTITNLRTNEIIYTCNSSNSEYVKVYINAGAGALLDIDGCRINGLPYFNGHFSVSNLSLPSKYGSYGSSTYNDYQIQYGAFFTLPIRKMLGYSFIGYFDSEGKQYTDEYGNSLFEYKKEEDLILYEKWEKIS